MNKVILQLWEESTKGEFPTSDGCSLHISLEEKLSFVSKIYESRNEDVPDKYERIVGPPVEVFVEDEIFEKIKTEKSLRLTQVELNNLIKFEELITK